MKILDRLSSFASRLGASLASIIKVVLLSKPAKSRPRRGGTTIIMGNGPSLRHAIEESFPTLVENDTTAVNFAANAPEYRQLRPSAYILVDPHFFRHDSEDMNVERLWKNLASTDWPMTLSVPISKLKETRHRLQNPSIIVRGINTTPVEGFAALRNFIYSRGLGMPRPRNVLIPAIMDAIADGYDTIYIAGADHSWTQTLSVDEENRVVSIQPHFYNDDKNELQRVATEYKGYHLHDILQSLHIAFRSYFEIADYAKERGVTIYNSTPGSFIDAFSRAPLPENQ